MSRLSVALGFAWLALAALAPADDTAGQPPWQRPITPEERHHWAYRPLANPDVPGDPRDAAANPVDRFLRTAQSRQGVAPIPQAGKVTLARRVYFDLVGLPPTLDELAAFLHDDAADAYEKLVDRLLASPAYGERWAQHWLDLARFAETDGFEHDLLRPNAWRYRDWVIDALNQDMPFDRFVQLQIAGDELRRGDRQAAIATGFLLCGPDMPDLNLQDERRHVVLNEITATVGSVFLAMQFGCAQCHDHKYDPIRQYDFYRLRAFFESADIFRDHPIPTPEEVAARAKADADVSPEDQNRERHRRELEALGKTRFRDKNPDVIPTSKQSLDELTKDERAEHTTLVEALRHAPRLPEYSLGRVVLDGERRTSHLFVRGDFRQPGPAVERGFPAVLDASAAVPVPADSAAPVNPRLQLARWLTRPDNPLAARVIVNRLWQWHFGIALAAAASDFGVMGSEPTHPDLLDWLSGRFIADGWSLKKMHRLLVTSQAYQTASGSADPAWTSQQQESAGALWTRNQATDPQNTLLWRRQRLRMDGETIRDAMLSAADQLSTRRGGPGVRPPLPKEITATLLKDQWQPSGDDEDPRRRSIYLFVRRNLRYPMFDVFDRPDTNASCPLRHESTTATQSLALLNSSFSLDCARHLAGVLLRSSPDSLERQIEQAYLRVLSRPPSAEESRLASEFLTRQQMTLESVGRTRESLALADGSPPEIDPIALAALVDFCLALVNSNPFVFID